MACNFQCGRTGYRRDGLLEGSQYLNVRRPDGYGCQNSQCHSGNAEQGAKWPLERMGADQGDIQHEWYSHLRTSMMLKKSVFSPAQPPHAKTRFSPSFVLASFRPSTYPRGYASALHSLRPRRTAFLTILRGASSEDES